ncbi:phosphatidylserine/phosphatidylglycerophosphate/cardiolipin synthase family protein [uncultured Ramlibacter sp.]|uniref:phospholipase D-like domain-containing protein n=1 Tax=uncultured Ramlibacter sp. TaxID=260755 RepID=UPI00260911E9|nr:phospholipase D family protein [uncultured Ramlibacter sp.]
MDSSHLPSPAALWRRLVLCLAAPLLLAACSSLPARMAPAPGEPQALIPASALGRIAAVSLPADQPSGFRLLPDGGQAFDTRMQLIDRAERSLDAQYYYIGHDDSGLAFLRALTQAAARGVRVRLLVDDLATDAIEPMLRHMEAQAGMEVRVFNPFCCGRTSVVGRFGSGAADLRRLNHRMHNKLLLADGALAVAGGRNMGDEYFARNMHSEFVDMDALMAGAIVPQLASVFARYWDSPPAWPLGQLPWDGKIGDSGEPAAPEPPSALDALGQTAPGLEFAAGRLTLTGGSAYAFADPPGKVLNKDLDHLHANSVTTQVRGAMWTARQEVVVSSPYLIPREMGMELIRGLAQQGVKMSILTNSMAANDSIFVHTGYARYRPEMLRHGVDLYELSPARSGRPTRSPMGMVPSMSIGRLHAKNLVIDRQTTFIGSMNLDPRSADKNTELGVLVDSPALAAQMLKVLDMNKRTGAYKLRLDAQGSIEWLATVDGKETVFTSEPETTPLMWLQNIFLSPLVPESLL